LRCFLFLRFLSLVRSTGTTNSLQYSLDNNTSKLDNSKGVTVETRTSANTNTSGGPSCTPHSPLSLSLSSPRCINCYYTQPTLSLCNRLSCTLGMAGCSLRTLYSSTHHAFPHTRETLSRTHIHTHTHTHTHKRSTVD
jgi:hypothetical protein